MAEVATLHASIDPRGAQRGAEAVARALGQMESSASRAQQIIAQSFGRQAPGSLSASAKAALEVQRALESAQRTARGAAGALGLESLEQSKARATAAQSALTAAAQAVDRLAKDARQLDFSTPVTARESLTTVQQLTDAERQLAAASLEAARASSVLATGLRQVEQEGTRAQAARARLAELGGQIAQVGAQAQIHLKGESLDQLARRAGDSRAQLQRLTEQAAALQAQLSKTDLSKLDSKGIDRLSNSASRFRGIYAGALQSASAASSELTARLRQTVGQAERLTPAFSSLGAVVGGVGLGFLARDAVRTIQSFQGMQASLETIEGSAEKAGDAFRVIKQLAIETPFTVEDVTRAFIRLRAQGLDASSESILAYGDLASSFNGKTILDFVEAVADGTQNQGRRLKEFGIGLSTEGKKVTLTFGEIRKTVQNDAKSIEKALRELAQQRFGGAMERQAQTVGGAFGRLEDAAAQFAVQVGEGGLAEALERLVRLLADTTQSGQATARALGELLGQAVDFASSAFKFLAENSELVKFAFASLVSLKVASFISGAATTAIAAVSGFRALMLATGGVTAAVRALTVAIAMNPIGILLTAASAGIVLLVTYRHEIAQMAEDIGKWVNDILHLREIMEALGLVEARKSTGRITDVFARAGGALTADSLRGAVGEVAGVVGPAFEANAARLAKEEAARKKAQAEAKKAESGAKAAEKLAKKIRDLARETQIEALAASERLGLLAASGEDLRGLEIETRLLKIRNSLIEAGAGEARAAAEAEKLRADVIASVDAEAEADKIEALRDALRGLREELSFEAERLGILAQGPAGREREEALALLEVRRDLAAQKIADPAQVAEAEALALAVGRVRREIEGITAREEVTRSLTEEIDTRRQLLLVLGQGAEALALEEEVLRRLSQAKREGQTLDAAFIAQTRAQVTELDRLNKALEQQAEKRDPTDAFRRFAEENADFWTQVAEIGVGAIDKLADRLAEFVATGKLDFKGFLEDLTRELSRAAFKGIASDLIKLVFEDGAVGAEVLHTGGVAGSGGLSRSVSPALFAAAPRYHSGGIAGIRPDEVPAILQRGETILPRPSARGLRRGRGQGQAMTQNNTINVQILTPDPDAFRAARPQVVSTLGRAVGLSPRRQRRL